MKPLLAALWALALLSLISSLPSAQAQTATAEARPTTEPFYDVTREVTLKGTVSSLVTRHSPGMIPGPYLFLETPSGEVAANLGRFALRGNGALSVAVGDQVEVTGMMKTLGGKQVFVVRSVKAGEQIYLMRNQYGIPVSPQARERVDQNAAEKGDSL
jgi:hypothetical protein